MILIVLKIEKPRKDYYELVVHVSFASLFPLFSLDASKRS